MMVGKLMCISFSANVFSILPNQTTYNRRMSKNDSVCNQSHPNPRRLSSNNRIEKRMKCEFANVCTNYRTKCRGRTIAGFDIRVCVDIVPNIHTLIT